MDALTQLLSRQIDKSASGFAYQMTRGLTDAFPDRFVLYSDDGSFDLHTWSQRRGVEVEVHPQPFPHWNLRWRGPNSGVHRWLDQGRWVFEHDGQRFDVFEVELEGAFNCTKVHRWWIGPNEASVLALADEVARVANEIVDELLVYSMGSWERDHALRKAIRGTTFDSLILPPGETEALLRDFRDFLDAEEDYRRFGVPWKRGALLMGPPGNGKTHCVKALVNALDLPCFYVRSFEQPRAPAQFSVSEVFQRVRRTTPCVLVLEDLDTLVTPDTRSVFLNELDGFAANDGIVTIATANHPERLDPAIVDRPSRFDRKYTFDVPSVTERNAYLTWWRGQVEAEVPLDEATIEQVAETTGGFSYAYLKELVLASLVGWVSEGRGRPLRAVMLAQVEALRSEMASPA